MPPSSPPIDPTATRVRAEFKHDSPLIGCRFDPSGRFLFATAQDNTIQRFDLLTGAKVSLFGHQSWARGLAFLPLLASAVAEVAAAAMFRVASPAVVGTGPAVGSAPQPHPITMISADYSGRLIWWSAAATIPTPIRTVQAHAGWTRAVAVSPNGKLVASCGNDHDVKLWRTMDGSPVRVLEGHTSHVYNVAFHPDGTHLASADLKGVVKDWNLTTGACVRELDAKILHKYDPSFMADIGGARGIAFAPDGRLACCGITNVSNAFAGVGNPAVVVFDWKSGKATSLKPKDAFQGTAWGIDFHPAGYVIAAGGGSGGRIWFWKGEEPTSIHTVTVPANARDLALHPAGDQLAVAGGNSSAIVYTLQPTGVK